MAVFDAQVDTINAHRGHAGCIPGHLKGTFYRIASERGLTMKMVLKWDQKDQEVLKAEVEAAASEE